MSISLNQPKTESSEECSDALKFLMSRVLRKSSNQDYNEKLSKLTLPEKIENLPGEDDQLGISLKEKNPESQLQYDVFEEYDENICLIDDLENEDENDMSESFQQDAPIPNLNNNKDSCIILEENTND